ncbi:SGNH/GDSL hydrolase family protein [uncultured Sulfitobacter sp.]|uniref:SGNH/GDSL hydrolase family protein n=1 Tax=uncultured Sulfitobacter sp. TaxID=191468 RepID=UPI0030D6F94C|tara:strand:- start:1437 stop:4247 length:2811 start_codon:yes stop_codon:yes gene_type:complete
MAYTLPTTGTDPKTTTKQALEALIDSAIAAISSTAINGFIYATDTTDGLARTSDGEGFFTASDLQLIFWLNDGGAATQLSEIGTPLTQAQIEELEANYSTIVATASQVSEDAAQVALDKAATLDALGDAEDARDIAEAAAGVVSRATSVAGLTAPATLTEGDGGYVSGSGDDAVDGFYQVQSSAWVRVSGTGLAGVRSDVESLKNLTLGERYSIGTLSNTGTPADTGLYWSNDLLGCKALSQIESIEINTTGPTTGTIIVVDASLVVTHEQAFTVTAAGNHIIYDENDWLIPTGSRVFINADNTNLSASTTPPHGSVVFTAVQFTALGDAVVTTPLAAGVASKVNWVSVEQADPSIDESVLFDLTEGVSLSETTSTWPQNAPNITAVMRAFDAGVDVPVGAIVSNVTADLTLYSDATTVRVLLLKRLTSAGEAAWDQGVDGSAFQVHQFDPADIDANIDGTDVSRLTFPVDPFIIEAGYSYFAAIQHFDGLTGVPMGIGKDTSTNLERQHHRGWYIGGDNFQRLDVYTAIGGNTVRVSIGLGYKSQKARDYKAAAFDVTTAEITVSGTTATVKATVRYGQDFSGELGTVSVPFAATGLTRYDLIWFNPLNRSFGRTAGTERAVEATEYIPAAENGAYKTMFHIRVTNAGHEWVPVWDLVNGDPPIYRDSLVAERERSKRALSKTRAKLMRGAAIHIVGIGDSTLALQTNGTANQTTPNGPERDVDTVYLESHGADYLATLTKFTAVELGRADDGAGAIHVKLSHVWRMVDALQQDGATVTYDNFAVGGYRTNELVGDTAPYAPTTWFQNALNLGGDLMIFVFGMNDLVTSAVVDRMVVAIEAAKSAGYEVIVMGVVRRNPGSYVRNVFIGINAHLRLAAQHAGAAYVDVASLYEDDGLGALGITASDTCKANDNNHPGVRECDVIAQRGLIPLVLA